jgi:hypothetical protein
VAAVRRAVAAAMILRLNMAVSSMGDGAAALLTS